MVTAAVAAGALAPVAGAHELKYDSTVTAKVKKGGQDAGTFSGEVESAKAKCVRDRKVSVYGVVDNADDALLGSDRTDDAGAWVFAAGSDLAADTHYAAAARKVPKKSKRHRHICKRAASEPIEVK